MQSASSGAAAHAAVPAPALAPPGRHAFGGPDQARAFGEAWRATRWAVYVACDVVHALFAVLLWREGYPAWRVAAYTAALALTVALHAAVELPSVRAREAAGDGRLRAWGERVWLVAMLVEIAVTGGVRSPLFPSNLAAIPLNVQQFGWSRSANLSAAAILVSAIAFVLAPAAWTGPTAPAAVYWTVLGGAVLATGGSSVLYRWLLSRIAEESVGAALRAREALAEQALARARELEQLGARISHELKNPLSAVKTLVQVSARSTDDPGTRERLEMVVREVRRMEATLRDHLSFSRPVEALSRAPLRLADVADDVLALVESRAREAGVALARRGDAPVEADGRRLREALLNLVANALEASSRGGTVELDIAAEGAEARIRVRDEGRGMPPEVLDRVGTPFFTTRDEGTGLGVTLARTTFVHHGGRLEYASAPGQGTVATAVIPLRAPESGDASRPRGG